MIRIVFSTPWEKTTAMLFCQMQDGFDKIVNNPDKCKYKGLPEVLASKGAVIKGDPDNPKQFFIEVTDPDTVKWVKKEYGSRLNRAGRGAVGMYGLKTRLEEIPPKGGKRQKQ